MEVCCVTEETEGWDRKRGETEMDDGDRERKLLLFFPPHVSTTNQRPHHHNYSSASAESPRGSEYKKTCRKQTFPHINTSAADDRSKKKKTQIHNFLHVFVYHP